MESTNNKLVTNTTVNNFLSIFVYSLVKLVIFPSSVGEIIL